jgi:hypothetical protein
MIIPHQIFPETAVRRSGAVLDFTVFCRAPPGAVSDKHDINKMRVEVLQYVVARLRKEDK